MRNCNQYHYFFSLKKYVLSQKKGLQKRGGSSAFPSKLFFKKNWSQNHIFTHCRSSRREMFCKKGVLRNLAKFTEKHLWQSLFFNKVAGLQLSWKKKQKTLAQVFPCEFCKISKNAFYYTTPPMAVSDTGIFENSFLFYGQS